MSWQAATKEHDWTEIGMKHYQARFIALSIASALLIVRPALAQGTPAGQTQLSAGRDHGGSLVRVVSAAPIYVQPDATRQPLRVAKEGSMLRVVQSGAQYADWTCVEFADPQYGPCVGYVQTKFLRVMTPAFQQEPVDVSVPTKALAPADAIERGRTPQAAFNKREPVVALALSMVLPGLGQLYNGPTEKKKGVAMIGAQAGFIAIMIAGAYHNTCSTAEIYSFDGCGVSPLPWIGFAGAVGNQINSMYDGYTKAGALNRRHGLGLSVKPEVVNGRNGVSAEARYQISW